MTERTYIQRGAHSLEENSEKGWCTTAPYDELNKTENETESSAYRNLILYCCCCCYCYHLRFVVVTASTTYRVNGIVHLYCTDTSLPRFVCAMNALWVNWVCDFLVYFEGAVLPLHVLYVYECVCMCVNICFALFFCLLPIRANKLCISNSMVRIKSPMRPTLLHTVVHLSHNVIEWMRHFCSTSHTVDVKNHMWQWTNRLKCSIKGYKKIKINIFF